VNDLDRAAIGGVRRAILEVLRDIALGRIAVCLVLLYDLAEPVVVVLLKDLGAG
jgi:hypothetical protein